MSATAICSSVEVIPGGPIHGAIRPPGSKSLTNRALVCAAFAKGDSKLTGALQSDDTHVMVDSLRRIGLFVDSLDRGTTLVVHGTSNGRSAPSDAVDELFIGNSGTTIRFLTAALSAKGGQFRLSGVPRMHQRPIGDLVNALTEVCEGSVACESPGGCPPVVIRTRGWSGDKIRVAGNVSSQYLSGLMMAVPISQRRVEIEVVGELVSRPYVEMTAQIMQDFGATARWLEPDSNHQQLRIDVDGRNGYQGREYAIEPDASAASYFWAAAAISGGSVTVNGLGPNAMQGDVAFVDCLEKMGCRVERSSESITVHGPSSPSGIDVDMNAISDTVQTLSVVALFASGPTHVTGVAHNRFKETDRIGDLARELRKLGAIVTEHEDGLTIKPVAAPESFGGAVLETYDDHRMAMSFALAGLRMPNVKILNPACTAKTYPEFFYDLECLIGRSHRWTVD